MSIPIIVPHSLDDYFQSTPIGSLDKAIGNNLYGVNHRQVEGAVPSNKELSGFTFFVRPQLNLQNDNVRNLRIFAALMNDLPLSVQRFVRCTLDPRLIAGYKFNNNKIQPITCPAVDNNNPFISILTNNINSISGWPDVTLPTFTSAPGLYNEAHTMADGIAKNYESFTVDASFRNTRGDPILYLFYIWLHYCANVFEGKLVPYLDMIVEREMDYYTRIFRISLDKDRRTVTKMFSTMAMPISVPTSAFADYNKERPYNEQNKDITIRFNCNGFETFDDVLVKEFNAIVNIFSPDMDDNFREQGMVKLSPAVAHLCNNRGLPRIDPGTRELEWWVPVDYFNARTQGFLAANLLNNDQLNISDELETGD